MGMGVAYLYSVVAAIAPRHLPDVVPRNTARPQVYFEAAAVITTLVLLGQVLELRARSHTSSAIRALLDLASEDRAASCATTAARRTCRSTRSARRSPAGAAGREGAGRRRGRRRRERR